MADEYQVGDTVSLGWNEFLGALAGQVGEIVDIKHDPDLDFKLYRVKVIAHEWLTTEEIKQRLNR